MVDRLDEIFPRRSAVERKALRGLLRATRFFSSDGIRVKIFLRDNKAFFLKVPKITSRFSQFLFCIDTQ
jgi:hypothetical protein